MRAPFGVIARSGFCDAAISFFHIVINYEIASLHSQRRLSRLLSSLSEVKNDKNSHECSRRTEPAKRSQGRGFTSLEPGQIGWTRNEMSTLGFSRRLNAEAPRSGFHREILQSIKKLTFSTFTYKSNVTQTQLSSTTGCSLNMNARVYRRAKPGRTRPAGCYLSQFGACNRVYSCQSGKSVCIKKRPLGFS